jgi:hypothetical protein
MCHDVGVPSERFPVRLLDWRKDLDVTFSSRSCGRRVIDALLSAHDNFISK